jgi:hypothetical protein
MAALGTSGPGTRSLKKASSPGFGDLRIDGLGMTAPEELIASTWLDELYRWYYCRNDHRPPGFWEAKRRRDADDALAQFGDEAVRLRAVESAEAVREFNALVRKRCAEAVLGAMIKAGYALRSSVIQECAQAVENASSADHDENARLSKLIRDLDSKGS